MAGLYLHIPFCEHKCIYCDFYSIENLEPMESFVLLLKKEIQKYQSYATGETFDTIFLGGGTPSLLSPRAIGDILSLLHTTFSVKRDAEITIEANPGTVNRTKLAEYLNVGVNRLSFGVQSFHQDDLTFLTRIHSSDEAKEAVRDAQDVGFNNINIDLIFSLPHQTLHRWEENLMQAVALGTQHISAYSLIVEGGTPLERMVKAKQVSTLPVEDDANLFELTMQFLGSHGFQQYEVSNYAKPGLECKHNINYWSHGKYLGFGPSAHSFWLNRRWWNIASLRSYCENLSQDRFPIMGEESLTAEQLLDESVILGLRSGGINFSSIKDRLGVDMPELQQSLIEELVVRKLAVMDKNTLRLTSKGMLLCDEIGRRLLTHPCAA